MEEKRCCGTCVNNDDCVCDKYGWYPVYDDDNPDCPKYDSGQKNT